MCCQMFLKSRDSRVFAFVVIGMLAIARRL